jgi:hypothetical protein
MIEDMVEMQDESEDLGLEPETFQEADAGE